MPASLDTIVTTLQNIVTAINRATTNYTSIQGAQDFFNITSASVVRVGPGRIVNISVVVAGSSSGTIYDSASTSDTTRPLAIIPNTVGRLVIGLPVQYGVMIVPGSGMTVAGSFS